MKKLVSFIAFVSLFSTYAFKLSPMTQQLVLNGEKRKAMFTITNDSEKPIAVQAEITKRLMDEYGKEENQAVEEEFLIFPDQLIIQPGERRAIQVTWLGKEKVVVEQPFRFVAEQLPVDMSQKKKKKSNIKILLKYRAAFYLTPVEASSKIMLAQDKVLVEKGSFELFLKNEGTKHEILKNFVLKVGSEKGEVSLPFSKLKGVFGENVLAKQSRRFKVSLPEKLKGVDSLSLSLVGEN